MQQHHCDYSYRVNVTTSSLLLLTLFITFTLTWARPARGQRYLQFEPASGSCFEAVVYEPSGEVTPLPNWLREVLTCAAASLSPDGRLLAYVAADAIALFDLDTQTTLPVLTLPLINDDGDSIRLENPPSFHWSYQFRLNTL